MQTADIIATSSLFVALFALFATISQQRTAHKHNKLSVRPLLTWNVARNTSDDGASITYTLRNQGLGPAVVIDRYFLKDGTRFHSQPPTLDMVPALIELALGNKVQYQLMNFLSALLSHCDPSTCSHWQARMTTI